MQRVNVNKNWILILIGVISFLALFIVLLDTIAPQSEFILVNFIRNMSTSIPFAILIAVIDYKLVIIINKSEWLIKKVLLRILVESIALILLAVIFVIIGNVLLFFIEGSDWLGYLSSTKFRISATAAILINIFTVTFIEFFVQVKRNDTLQKEILKMQYAQLKSQINPHFLFNSLNILTSLIHKNSEQAVHYTQKLSQIYRYVLTQDTKELTYIADELEFIETYVEVLRIRYGDVILCNIDVSNTDSELFIPPMSLQLLVENAVKHNSLTVKNPLIIDIKVQEENLVVSNNIIPRTRVEDSTGIGLKNLEQKYKIISERSIKIDKTNSEFKVILPVL